MASVSSLFGVFPKRGFVDPKDSGIYALKATHGPIHLQLDVMESEAPEYRATPSRSQVEDAATISAHVTLQPIKLSVSGIVTDTPIGFARQYSKAFSGSKPSEEAFTYLENLYKNAIPFDFVGGFRVYNSMIIAEWRPTRNAQTGDALRFTCTMEQVRIVSSQLLTKGPKKLQSKTSHGSQPLKSVNVTQATAVQSSFHGVEPTAGTIGSIPTGSGSIIGQAVDFGGQGASFIGSTISGGMGAIF